MSEPRSYVAFKREVLKRLPNAYLGRSGSHWSATLRSGEHAISGHWFVGCGQTVDDFCTGLVVELDRLILSDA